MPNNVHCKYNDVTIDNGEARAASQTACVYELLLTVHNQKIRQGRKAMAIGLLGAVSYSF